MKTRKEILEADHDSALTQLVENEINVAHMEGELLGTLPGPKYDEMKKSLDIKKENVKNISHVLSIIESMLLAEEKKTKEAQC